MKVEKRLPLRGPTIPSDTDNIQYLVSLIRQLAFWNMERPARTLPCVQMQDITPPHYPFSTFALLRTLRLSRANPCKLHRTVIVEC